MMTESVRDVLPPAQRTLPEMLRRQAALFGNRPLLRIAGRQWSHQDASHVAAGRGAALVRAGVQRGDRVALMLGNCAEFLEVFLGCGWIGASAVPINTASMSPQIAYFLTNSEATLLVIDAQWLGRLHAADLSGTALREIWVVGPTDGGCLSKSPLAPGASIVSYPEAAPAIKPAVVRPGDPLALLYTSGTTGPAKGVICPHAQYYWWGLNSAQVLELAPDDVLCSTLPLFHINALNTFAQAMVVGAEVVFESRFSASGFWPAMKACGATVVYLLGAMVPILLTQPEGPAERDHRVRTGLGPGVPAVAGSAFFTRTGVLLLEGYGSTETNFVIATRPESPHRGVMGWLRPGFYARVADENDAEVPCGESGELLLRADEPFAFASGYHGMPAQTVEAWRNLWFHTGDRVVRETDGSFRFVDRIKDAIRRRGENISSFEVEQVLLSHSGIVACAVYPVGSELAEDEVMAALVPSPEETVDPAEVVRFCEVHLPYFAVPRYIDLLDDLPRTENGKVQKYKLRERGVTGATWDRALSRESSKR